MVKADRFLLSSLKESSFQHHPTGWMGASETVNWPKMKQSEQFILYLQNMFNFAITQEPDRCHAITREVDCWHKSTFLTLHSHRSAADYKNEILGPRNILRCCALRSVWRENKIIEVTKNLLLDIKIFKTIIKIIITIIIIMSQEKIIIILLGQSPGLKVIWSMANPPLLAFPSNTRRNVFLMSTATWGNRRVEQLSAISIIHVTQ